MNPQRHADEQPKRNPEEHRQAASKEAAHPKDAHQKDAHPKDAHAKAEQASRSVMHPESYDPEWRYYHGAWGG